MAGPFWEPPAVRDRFAVEASEPLAVAVSEQPAVALELPAVKTAEAVAAGWFGAAFEVGLVFGRPAAGPAGLPRLHGVVALTDRAIPAADPVWAADVAVGRPGAVVVCGPR